MTTRVLTMRGGRRRATAGLATTLALTLVGSLWAGAPAFADPGPDLAARSEAFADIVDSLGLDDPVAAQAMTGGWDTLAGTPGFAELPAEAPAEDEEVVVLAEEEEGEAEGEGGGGTVPASLSTSTGSAVAATDPPEPVDVDLGGLDVTVLAPSDPAATPEAVRLRVAGEAETSEAGVTGVILEVTDESATPPASDPEIGLTVSYATFAGLAGGDWASRLKFVWIPDCTPGPDCRPTEIETANDTAAQTVTAVVPVGPSDGTTTASLASFSTSESAAEGDGGGGGSLAITAGTSSGSGDWGATSLSPSATWGAGGSTGAFSWNLPLSGPTVVAGPKPDLSISYSSASSDGRIPSANNQAGLVGEGFDLPTSYIERSYVPCSQDEEGSANNVGHPSGDLCWGTENATMMFQGTAVELIREAGTDTWHSKFDDGTIVQRISGGSWNAGEANEYWKVTTSDGTQYFFGRNKRSASDVALNSAWTVPVYGNHAGERCHDADFADSSCTQVWRWNLEYVVDTNGDSMTYSYSTESNRFVSNAGDNWGGPTTSYISGGRLDRIEYGTRAGQETSGSAPAHITFTTTPRCITDIGDPDSFCTSGQTSTTSNEWVDTPTDLICTGDPGETCTNSSPVFFDRYKLSSITSSAFDGSVYQPVDRWTLDQAFAPQGTGIGLENAQGAMLVLRSVTHTGMGGTASTSDDISLPPTEFGYTFLENRVDSPTDGQPSMWRPRITAIRTDSGAGITVNYRTDCSVSDLPDTSEAAQAANTRLCYPVKWYPLDDPVINYFHKYVVDTIVESGAAPASGGDELITGSLAKVTTYAYEGGSAWAKPTGAMVKPNEVTYSDFRGFASVVTTVGLGDESSSSRTLYYRGTDGTLTAGPAGHTVSAVDRLSFQGKVFSSVQLNGATQVSETVNVPGDPVETAENSNGVKATRIPSNTAYGFSYDASGALVFRTKSVTTLDADGQVTSVSDSGDLATTADDKCTTITYAHESNSTLASRHILILPTLTQVVSKTCSVTPSLPADLISSDTMSYDDQGRNTRIGRIDPTDGVGDVLVSEAHSFDAHGRPLEKLDATGNRATFAYTESAGGLPATMTTTTPDPDGPFGPLAGFATTTTFNPLTGTLLSSADANGRTTTGTYDALGRLLTVRYPQHAGVTLPSVEYFYSVDHNGLNAVVTKTLGADGTSQHVSSVLYDGLLRPFQYQSEGLDAGEAHAATGAARGRNVSHVYYDSAGNLSLQTGKWWATGAPTGAPIVPVAVPPSQTTFEYDSAGRTTAQVFWVGNTSVPANEKWRTTTVYDGATTVVIPPAGGTPQATVMDAAGHTVELRQYLRDPDLNAGAVTAAAVLALPHQSTTYSFDSAGRMVEIHDPENNEWSFDFDWAGRQTGATDPDAGVTTTTYDSLDRVVTRTNGESETVAYTYDNIGRTLTLRDGSVNGPMRVQWTYDQAKDAQGNSVLGLQSASTRFVDGHAYTTSFTKVDAADRPLTAKISLPDIPEFDALASLEFTTKVTYAADGQVSAVSLPAIADANGHRVLGAETVTTRYDTAGLPSWMSGGFGWGTYVAESRYGADGRASVLDLGNTYGAYLSYSYEEGTDRLSGMALDRQNHGTALDLRYTYDAAGNVLSVKDQPTGAAAAQDNQCFGYDDLQRLSVAWTARDADCEVAQNAIDDSDVGGAAPYWTEYGYDPLGNRTSLIEHGLGTASDSVTTYTQAGVGPHQVTGTVTSTGGIVSSASYSYDDAGRQASTTEDGVTTDYTWDAESKLVGVDDDTNVYDAAGNRLVRVDEDGITVFLGDQEVHIDGSDVTATRYYSFAGQTVAVRASGGLGAVSSLVTDSQGSIIASVPNTDWSPTSVQRIFTDPFGAARDGSSSSVPGDRRFLGAVQDATSGLVLLGARFFDQSLGRFISVDPVLDQGVPAQFNAYSYAWNNPVTQSDPTGLKPLGSGDSGCGCSRHKTGKAGGSGGGHDGAGGVARTTQPTPLQQFFDWLGKTNAAHAAARNPFLMYAAGFTTDEDGDLDTRRQPWQLVGGYNDVYDEVFRAVTFMEADKYTFNYDGNQYVLWVWKGDYLNFGAGGEIGIYMRPGESSDEGGHWFANPWRADMPEMSMSLEHKGETIASNDPVQAQVWVGSFDPDVQDPRVNDLTLNSTVTFPDSDMFEAFRLSQAGNKSPWQFDPKNNTATLRWRRRKGVR